MAFPALKEIDVRVLNPTPGAPNLVGVQGEDQTTQSSPTNPFPVRLVGSMNMAFFQVALDAAGVGVINLTSAPANLLSVAVICTTDSRIVWGTAVAGAALSVSGRKATYDKTVSPSQGVRAASLPAGITLRAVKVNADTTTSGNALAVDPLGAGNAPIKLHTHGVSHEYEHDHALTFADAPLNVIANEAVNVLVIWTN